MTGIIIQMDTEQLQALIAKSVEAAVRNALKQERKQADAESKLLTHKEAADMLKVSSSTLQVWVKEGRIKQTRIGKSGVRYLVADIKAAVENGLAFKFLHNKISV